MKRLALLLLALTLPAAGASAAVPPANAKPASPPPSRGPLAHAITLTEVPEAKNVTVPSLPFGTEAQDVDVNSTIRIEISKDNLLAAVPATLKTGASQDVDLLIRSSRDLQAASASLATSIQKATEFARGLNEGKPPAVLTQLAKADDEGLRLMVTLVKSYKTSLAAAANPDYKQHAKDATSRANKAAESTSRLVIAAFLVDELRWTTDQLAAARQRLTTDAPPVALLLSAVHVHDGKEVELGLPHYNNLPIGAPVSIDKTSLVISAEQQQQLQALETQYAALAKVLNDAVSGSADLKALLKQFVQTQGIDVDKLTADLDKIGQDVKQLQTTDWDAVGKKLEDQAKTILNGAVAADKKILTDKVLPAIASLRTDAANARTTLEGLRAQALALQSQVGEGSAPAQDPAVALVQILSLADSLTAPGQTLTTLLASVDHWKQVLQTLKDQASTIPGTLTGLSQSVKTQLQALLEQTAQDQLGSLLTDLEQLRTDGKAAVQQAQALLALRDPAKLAIALDREPPAAAIAVAFGEIQSTYLDLRTLNPRAEDDVVVLRAWLYRVETVAGNPGQVVVKEQLASDLQQLRMLRFGWFTGPSVGLVYTSAVDKLKGQDKETRTFAPMVSFLWSRRSWDRGTGGDFPLRSTPSVWESFGIGLHTITLDLDKDNQPELGLGLSISLFNGYLQLGGGIDLSLKEQPKYVFIGTRLFDFARNLGFTTKPAAPVQ